MLISKNINTIAKEEWWRWAWRDHLEFNLNIYVLNVFPWISEGNKPAHLRFQCHALIQKKKPQLQLNNSEIINSEDNPLNYNPSHWLAVCQNVLFNLSFLVFLEGLKAGNEAVINRE